MHTAEFVFEYPSPEDATVVEQSVRVEAGDITGGRTRATVERDDATLTVTVDATDLTALRAGVNTWLSLVDVAETTAETQSASRSA